MDKVFSKFAFAHNGFQVQTKQQAALDNIDSLYKLVVRTLKNGIMFLAIMISNFGINITNVYIEDGNEFWNGMEDFYYGIEENARMEDGKNVFHSILCPDRLYPISYKNVK